MTRPTPLHDVQSLDAAIAESCVRPVLLFKHSRHCGVSCEALDELQIHVDSSDASVAYKMITVQTHRPVSDAAAERLGLRHETPQAILLRGGKAVWNASHWRITASNLDQLLKAKASKA
jgi:thioredoxin 1